jgi:hypothetical protein
MANREAITFRVAPETKRRFFSELALRGQKAQDFFEEIVKNFLEDAMTDSPLRFYAIIDNHSGYLWEIARAETPEAACRKIDGHITPDAKRQYVPVYAHELAANDTAYHVFELDRATYDSLRDADGQGDEAIQTVNDYGELVEVFKIEEKED